MFSFKKKQSQQEQQVTEVKVQEQKLPEGCEVMLDCEFAEVSGGNVATTNVSHFAL